MALSQSKCEQHSGALHVALRAKRSISLPTIGGVALARRLRGSW